MPGSPSSNGHLDLDDEDPLDEAPLDPGEEAAAALEAGTAADESLAERVETVIGELGGVELARDGEAAVYLARGRAFAVLMADRLEVAMEPRVAKAALRTADTRASSRGTGWIVFTPAVIDRFALDRAEAWVRSAYRRVTGG